MNIHFKLALFNLKMAAYGNLIGLRVLLALSSLTWAVLTAWAMLPIHSLTLISPTQEFIVRVVPQYVWALAFAVQGVAGLSTALFNTRSVIVGMADRLLGVILWNASTVVLIIGFLYTGRNLPPIWATHLMMSLLSVWILFHNNNDTKSK